MFFLNYGKNKDSGMDFSSAYNYFLSEWATEIVCFDLIEKRVLYKTTI
jgi:hypothetical protein